MSRNALCYWIAGSLAVVALGVAALRYAALGGEALALRGEEHYQVTLVVRGTPQGEPRLVTACPLDFHKQHIYGEEHQSEQLVAKHVESKNGTKRHLQWLHRGTGTKGPVEVRYSFQCTLGAQHPSASMSQVSRTLHSAPRPGECLLASPAIDPNHPDVSAVARNWTADLDKPLDQVRALFHHVQQHIHKEPTAGASKSAVDCLQAGRGDALAQSRLLVALCRNRGIPARLVGGLILNRAAEQKPHAWVETWVDGVWVALCPFHNHLGKVPAHYLVFTVGEAALVRSSNFRHLDYAFLVEQVHPGKASGDEPLLRRAFRRVSLHSLPPPEYRLVEFLLLLPLAALMICFVRQVIGLPSFGTFAPALIGLAFRDSEHLSGILVFVGILLVGWCLRRVLDHLHLLQVPRTAFMLTLVVTLLVGLVLAANERQVAATRYLSLFPMVILVGMIERFWTQEAEEGTWSSFKVLFSTLLMAATVSLVLSLRPVLRSLTSYPELIGLVMAGQVLLGRYTGYRLSELIRFRALVEVEERRTIATRVRIHGTEGQPEPRPLLLPQPDRKDAAA